MGAGLFIYGQNQKTYPGYQYWLTATFLVGIAYKLLSLQGVAPDWLTIPVANTFVFVSAVLRAEGMKHFVGRRKLSSWNFWMSVLVLVWYSYFTFATDNIAIRNGLFTLLTVVIIVWLARLLLSNPWDKPKKITYFFLTTLGIYGVFLVARAIGMAFAPANQSLTSNTLLNNCIF